MWLYIPERQLLTSMTTYMNELQNGLLETPIVFMLLDDREGRLYNALIDWQVAVPNGGRETQVRTIHSRPPHKN